jgi:phytoene dehydrogenase-like protein
VAAAASLRLIVARAAAASIVQSAAVVCWHNPSDKVPERRRAVLLTCHCCPGFHAVMCMCAERFKESWRRAASATDLLPRPNVYVAAPTRTDPSAAPSGCDSLMALLPVANLQERHGDSDYTALVDMGRARVLDCLAAAGVAVAADDILAEEVRDPSSWRQLYGVEHGAAFGLSHGLNQLAVLRPPLRAPRLGGLYFAGASTRPGNGVPLAMLSGRLCAQRVLLEAAAGGVR